MEVANFVPLKMAIFGCAVGAVGDFHRHLAQALVADDAAADQEGVAGGEGGGEALLDLAERRAAAAAEADLERVGVLDRADVHADLARGAGVAEFPEAVGPALEPLPAVVGAERVAARGDEVEAGVEFGAGEVGVGAGGGDLRVERGASKGPAQAAIRICWQRTSRGPRPRGSPSRSWAFAASSAATHSTTSKRLAGTRSAFDGAL